MNKEKVIRRIKKKIVVGVPKFETNAWRRIWM